jgi:hypothetical protein
VRISPDLLAGVGAVVFAVHLLCALLFAASLLRSGTAPSWRRRRLGVAGTSVAGIGFALLWLVVFENRTPSRVNAWESWAMLGGLLAAAVGQATVLRSLFGGGGLASPSNDPDWAWRLYVALAPWAVFALLVMLWLVRGMA